MSDVAGFPRKVRDFIQTHGVPVFTYPHLEATDDIVRQRRGHFGEYMLFALAFVEMDGRVVLIQQHYGEHLEGGVWKTPGGGVEADEDIAAAAVREVKEETGLDIELLAPVGVVQTGRRGPTEGTIDAYIVFFAARATGGELRPGDATEIAQVRLATLAEIDRLIAEGMYSSRNQPYFRAGEITCMRRWAALYVRAAGTPPAQGDPAPR